MFGDSVSQPRITDEARRHRFLHDVWAEPNIPLYEPSHYAVCFMGPSGPLDATQGAAEIPAPAQALLLGKEQHIYDPKIGAPWSLIPAPQECFKITDAETTTLLQMSQRNACDGYNIQLCGRVAMSVVAIFPHGQYVVWGG